MVLSAGTACPVIHARGSHARRRTRAVLPRTVRCMNIIGRGSRWLLCEGRARMPGEVERPSLARSAIAPDVESAVGRAVPSFRGTSPWLCAPPRLGCRFVAPAVRLQPERLSVGRYGFLKGAASCAGACGWSRRRPGGG